MSADAPVQEEYPVERLDSEVIVARGPIDPASEALKRLQRYYDLAKRQAWNVSDLAWDTRPVLPERQMSERWLGVWHSMLAQLVRADEMAVKASVQLLMMA